MTTRRLTGHLRPTRLRFPLPVCNSEMQTGHLGGTVGWRLTPAFRSGHDLSVVRSSPAPGPTLSGKAARGARSVCLPSPSPSPSHARTLSKINKFFLKKEKHFYFHPKVLVTTNSLRNVERARTIPLETGTHTPGLCAPTGTFTKKRKAFCARLPGWGPGLGLGEKRGRRFQPLASPAAACPRDSPLRAECVASRHTHGHAALGNSVLLHNQRFRERTAVLGHSFKRTKCRFGRKWAPRSSQQ